MSALEPLVANYLPADVKIAEKLESDGTDVIALFEKWIIWCIWRSNHVTYTTVQPTVTVFDTATRPNLVHTSFLTAKWRERARLI